MKTADRHALGPKRGGRPRTLSREDSRRDDLDDRQRPGVTAELRQSAGEASRDSRSQRQLLRTARLVHRRFHPSAPRRFA
jgi:hypothetical protein